MCGISGVSSSSSFSVKSLDSLYLKYIMYRGPNNYSTRYFRRSNFLMCHTRLSIIDPLPSSNQPFVSQCGNFALTFNGEIYNYKKLKSLLISRYSVTFSTHSDTEVLLNLLIFFPLSRVLQMLDGMFAFAFYDSQNNRLSLARDRFGEKPLYFTSEPKKYFAFSSSFRTLYNSPFVNSKIDPIRISAYLAFGTLNSPLTLSNDIHSLPQGSSIVVDLNDYEYDLSSFFSPQNDTPFVDVCANPLATLDALLIQSISSRMTADVPVGFFLSGGIDSSLITSIASGFSNTQIDTFSLGVPGHDSSELDYASQIADHLNTNHNEVLVISDDLHYAFELMPCIYDLPISDPSIIPTLILHHHASCFSTVFLSGDGADELFGGYNRHNIGLSIYKFFALLPPNLKSFLLHSVSSLSDASSNSVLPSLLSAFSVLSSLTRLQKFSRMDFSSDILSYYLSTLSCSPSSLRALHRMLFVDNFRVPDRLNSLFQVLLRLDQSFYLPDTLFAKSDRSSMFHSIEVRSPFVSNAIFNFSRSLPDAVLTNGRSGKLLLSKLLSSYLPQSLYSRPKMGFTIDLNDFLLGDGLYILHDYLGPHVFDILPTHLVDYFSVRCRRYLDGDVACFSDVFSLLSLSMSVSNL